MAFSGVASASYVTNSGSKTIYHDGYKDVWQYNIVHYNKNHVVVKIKLTMIYSYGGSSSAYVYTDLKKTSKNKIKIKVTTGSGGYKVTKTGYVHSSMSISTLGKKLLSSMKKEMS